MPTAHGIQRAFHAEQPHPSGLVKLSVLPDRAHFLAGREVAGIVQLECASEKVFLGDIWLECYGSEELQSLEHTASDTFYKSDTPFQAPHIPPCAAVISARRYGPNLYGARRGRTRFRFRLPLPDHLPSSGAFHDAASITYCLKAHAQVAESRSRVLVTKVAEFGVNEQWSDWDDEKYHAVVRKETSQRIGSGSIVLAASALRRLWTQHDEVQLDLHIKNTTEHPITSVDVSLARELHPRSPEGERRAAPPQLSSWMSQQTLPAEIAAHEERQLQIRLPVHEHSIRGRKLFDIDYTLHATAMPAERHLDKSVSVSLPISVASQASLPKVALTALAANIHQDSLSPVVPPQRSPSCVSPAPPLSLPIPIPGAFQPPASPLPAFGLLSHSPFPSPICSPSISPIASPVAMPGKWGPASPSLSPMASPVSWGFSTSSNPPTLPASPSTMPAASPAPWGSQASPVLPFNPSPKDDPFDVGLDVTKPKTTPSLFMEELGMKPVTTRPVRSQSDTNVNTIGRGRARPPLPPVPARPPSLPPAHWADGFGGGGRPPSLTPALWQKEVSSSPNVRAVEADLHTLSLSPSEGALAKSNLEPAPNYNAIQRAKSPRRNSAPTPPQASPKLPGGTLSRFEGLEAIGEDGESQAGSRLTVRREVEPEHPSGFEESQDATLAQPVGVSAVTNASRLEQLVEQEGFLESEGLPTTKSSSKQRATDDVEEAAEASLPPSSTTRRVNAMDIFKAPSSARDTPKDQQPAGTADPDHISDECDKGHTPNRAVPSSPTPYFPTRGRSTATIKSEAGLSALESRLTKSPVSETISDTSHAVRPRRWTDGRSTSRAAGALRAKSSHVSLQSVDASGPSASVAKHHPPSARLQAWLSAVGPGISAKPTSPGAEVIRPVSVESAGKSEIEARHSVSQIRRPVPCIHAQTHENGTARAEEECQPSLLTLPAPGPSIERSPSPTSVLKSRSPKRQSQMNPEISGAGEVHEQQLQSSASAPLSDEEGEEDKGPLRLNSPPTRLHPSRIMKRPDASLPTSSPDHNGRSARGGRGGQVTSVAHLWQQMSGQKDADPRSLPPDIPTSLNLDPAKTSAPLRGTSDASNGRRVSLRALHHLMSDAGEQAGASTSAPVAKQPKRRSAGGPMASKGTAAPTFLNISGDENARLSMPSVLSPTNANAAAVSDDGPSKARLQALIARYESAT